MKTFIKNRKESTEDQTVVNDDAKNETDSKVSDIDHNYLV